MICIGPRKTKIQLEAVLKTEYQHYYSFFIVRIKLSEQTPVIDLMFSYFKKAQKKHILITTFTLDATTK